MKLQRLGGYAAIASVFGVAAYVVLVTLGINVDLSDPAKFKAAVSATPFAFYALCVLQIVRFTLWQIMFIALHERMQNKTPQLARMSLITASAGTAVQCLRRVVPNQHADMLSKTIPQLPAWRS